MINIIVSPSGKLYGSEQVLMDYLRFSRGKFVIFVCGRDLLYHQLKSNFSKHEVYFFNNAKVLYLRIFFLCLVKRVKTVYVNEAGHSRYVTLFSRITFWVRYVIHVRLIEDAQPARWSGYLDRNVIVISVSEFISKMLSIKSVRIYDPYLFSYNKDDSRHFSESNVLTVGVIGRVSITKGVDRLIKLLQLIQDKGYQKSFRFKLFGDIMPDVREHGEYEQLRSFSNVELCGFVSDRDKIFDDVDCIVHASGVESLGRVFLEAIDYGKPFIGLRNGGSGEIGGLLELNGLLIDTNEGEVSDLLLNKLLTLRDNYNGIVKNIKEKKNLAMNLFDPEKYAEKIDSLVLS